MRISFTKANKLFKYKIIISDDHGNRGPTHFAKTRLLTPIVISEHLIIFLFQRMTCNGENVWNLVEDEINWEIRQLQTWRLPVVIIVPIAGVVIIGLAVYLIYQRIR